MATATEKLAPMTAQAPGVVDIPKELSGGQWCIRFQGSSSISRLRPSFQLRVSDFVWAMEQAGAKVNIDATYRPKERAYLMHWAYRIGRQGLDPASVPEMAGVLIQWVHPTRAASTAAANQMIAGFRIGHLVNTPPALDTLHSHGEAIDMSISWSGTLRIRNRADAVIEIASVPRDGMNAGLRAVGASFGVLKYIRGSRDRPHWSSTGR